MNHIILGGCFSNMNLAELNVALRFIRAFLFFVLARLNAFEGLIGIGLSFYVVMRH